MRYKAELIGVGGMVAIALVCIIVGALADDPPPAPPPSLRFEDTGDTGLQVGPGPDDPVCWIVDGMPLGCVRFSKPRGERVCNSTRTQCVTTDEVTGAVCNQAHTACVRWIDEKD